MATGKHNSGRKPVDERTRVLLDAALKINENLDIGAILRQLIVSALKLTDSQGGTYGLYKDGRMVFTEYMKGEAVQPIDYSFPPGYGVPGWVLENKRPYVSNDAEHDPFVIPEICKKLGFYNLADTPIISRSGELVGCFEIHNTRWEGGYSVADIEILVALSSIAALAIDNAELIEEKIATEAIISSRLELEGLISRLSTDFINLEIDKIDNGINTALESLAEFFCVDRAYIFQYSPDGMLMSNTHEWCRKGIKPHITRLQNIPVELLPWFGRQMKNLDVVQVDNIETLPEEAAAEKQEWKLEGILSLVCVPMVCRGELAGFVGLDSVLYYVPWEKDVVILLRMVGEIFANALARKKAEQAIITQKNKAQHYLDIAGTILVAIDHQQQVTLINKKGLSVFKYNEQDIIGKNWFNWFVPAEEREFVRRKFDALMAGKLKAAEHVENRIVTSTGEKRLILWHNKILRDESGKVTGILSSGEDITEQRAIQEALQKSEGRFRSLVETTSDFIWEVDTEGKYTYVSPKVKDLLGYEPEELIGKTPFNMMPADEAQRVKSEFRFVALEKKPFSNLENVNVHKDGHFVTLETSGVPIFDPNGRFCGHRGMDRDITERKQAQHELLILNKELNSKNKELEAILFAAAHDMRSPLVNISGFSFELTRSIEEISSLIDKILSASDRERLTSLRETVVSSLRYISSSIDKMDALLSGLLSVSRLGTAVRKPETIDMTNLIRGVASSLEYQIQEKGVELNISPLPACFADPLQTAHIFQNLLGNAIKFLEPARKGRITVTGVENEWENVYCVEDNGIGIKPEYFELIFDIFYRLDPERTPGDGLGLTIVRRLAELNNGRVWVESQMGEGSRFYVAIPRAKRY